jgi:L,D-transpeptidase YbiS
VDRTAHAHRRQIVVSIAEQRLTLLAGHAQVRSYAVSTALNGAGERVNSGCTPRGRHILRIVIGRGCALNTVFIGRRPSGEIYSPELAVRQPQRDWILTRILWLSGAEPGFNRGGECDTLKRYIYIHGSPGSEPMGVPRSHGCIRMRSHDIAELADLVNSGDEVVISE